MLGRPHRPRRHASTKVQVHRVCMHLRAVHRRAVRRARRPRVYATPVLQYTAQLRPLGATVTTATRPAYQRLLHFPHRSVPSAAVGQQRELGVPDARDPVTMCRAARTCTTYSMADDIDECGAALGEARRKYSPLGALGDPRMFADIGRPGRHVTRWMRPCVRLRARARRRRHPTARLQRGFASRAPPIPLVHSLVLCVWNSARDGRISGGIWPTTLPSLPRRWPMHCLLSALPSSELGVTLAPPANAEVSNWDDPGCVADRGATVSPTSDARRFVEGCERGHRTTDPGFDLACHVLPTLRERLGQVAVASASTAGRHPSRCDRL